MNTVLFVNATIGFSENLYLVNNNSSGSDNNNNYMHLFIKYPSF